MSDDTFLERTAKAFQAHHIFVKAIFNGDNEYVRILKDIIDDAPGAEDNA